MEAPLLAGLAAQRAGADRRHDRRFEAAAQLLQQGIQLLQRMGQQPDLRQTLENDLKGLLPYRILDLISRDLNDRSNREHGLELLLDLVERRGGLDGDEDKDFPQEAFQSFFQQIRGFLTVQEQIDLFQLWSEAGSVTAEFLRAYALTASGFAQRKPERIQESLDRLALLQDVGVEPEMACLHLLLGHTDAAESCFQRGSDEALKQWARDQGDDPLAGLCVYCCDWLERQVLPCYRDLEADGFFFAVAKLAIRYTRPARYDDVLVLETRVSGAGRAKIEHGYELYRDRVLLATATTTVVCLDRDGRPQPIPDTVQLGHV